MTRSLLFFFSLGPTVTHWSDSTGNVHMHSIRAVAMRPVHEEDVVEEEVDGCFTDIGKLFPINNAVLRFANT